LLKLKKTQKKPKTLKNIENLGKYPRL